MNEPYIVLAIKDNQEEPEYACTCIGENAKNKAYEQAQKYAEKIKQQFIDGGAYSPDEIEIDRFGDHIEAFVDQERPIAHIYVVKGKTC